MAVSCTAKTLPATCCRTCMRCGQPAVDHIRGRSPIRRVGFTILIAWPVTLVLILVLTKKMTADAGASGTAGIEAVMMMSPLLVFLVLGLSGPSCSTTWGRRISSASTRGPCPGSRLVVRRRHHSADDAEITDDSITLKNVDESFCSSIRASGAAVAPSPPRF